MKLVYLRQMDMLCHKVKGLDGSMEGQHVQTLLFLKSTQCSEVLYSFEK